VKIIRIHEYKERMNKEIEENKYCCSKGQYLFHDENELEEFSNENDD